MRRGNLQLTRFSEAQLNERLRQITESLDQIEGVKGNFVRQQWTHGDDFIKYADANGTVLHGWGNV